LPATDTTENKSTFLADTQGFGHAIASENASKNKGSPGDGCTV
jgi:hypothetical protein